MTNSTPNGLMARFSSSHPELITALVSSGFFRAGNAMLADDPHRPVQLRPCAPWERRYVDPSDPADNALLVHRNNGFVLSVHFVTVHPNRMANTPGNVEAAIADLAEHEPLRALVLRRAVSKAAEAARAAINPEFASDLFAAPRSRRARRRERTRAGSQKGGPRQARPSA